MAKPLCMNYTNSGTDRYSSPIPLIGLYIAGATLVCLLLMLIDIISGLRRKFPYIPCQFFSFNSATLTLIGVASKLPVDLTTYMPSARDQLSKLTGTAMVCICIGFAMPSLGVNKASESIANMIALSLLIITILVNICIQMSTGIIYSFMVEHILILCCMLTLLFMLWCSTFANNSLKFYTTKWHRDLFSDRDKTKLMHQLNIWCIGSRIYNPQLLLWNSYSGIAVDSLCISCLIVVSQAAFRSLIVDKFDYCEGISDYGWSMWMIVFTQIVTIIIGGLAIGFRWLALILLKDKVEVDENQNMLNIIKVEMIRLKEVFSQNNVYPIFLNESQDFLVQFSLLKARSMKMLIASMSWLSIKFVMLVMFVLIFLIIAFVPLCLSVILVSFIKECCPSSSDQAISEDIALICEWKTQLKITADDIHYLYKVIEWMKLQCMKDMKKWMNRKKGEDSTNSYMVQMLSTVDESSVRTLVHVCHKITAYHWIPLGEDYKITCLLMVLMVKILSASISSPRVDTLRRALDETFKIIYFIEERINVGDIDNERRRELAKLLWASGDIDVSEWDSKHSYNSVEYLQHVISVVECYKLKSLSQSYLKRELLMFKDIIVFRGCKTVEELCTCSEQLFATMLYYYLAQLPNVIYKEVDSCPIEEMEERAQVLVKLLGGILESSLLSELESSQENKVEWVFPEGVPYYFEEY